MNVPEHNRQQGRPRCELTKAAILAAARKLFEGTNLRDLTIEAVAKEAGVSKATIYRWWSSKAELMMDACVEELRRHTSFHMDDGDAVAVITGQMRRLISVFAGPLGRIVAQLLAEGQYEPEICRRFFETHAGERFQALGQLLNGTPEEMIFLAEILYGPIYFRLIRGFRPLDEDFADRMTADAAVRIRNWRA